MNNFTISQLAQFSGVKAHTIRMWEQRYGFPVPDRTASGYRVYTEEDGLESELLHGIAATGVGEATPKSHHTIAAPPAGCTPTCSASARARSASAIPSSDPAWGQGAG